MLFQANPHRWQEHFWIIRYQLLKSYMLRISQTTPGTLHSSFVRQIIPYKLRNLYRRYHSTKWEENNMQHTVCAECGDQPLQHPIPVTG
jgi:hypothetical protein